MADGTPSIDNPGEFHNDASGLVDPTGPRDRSLKEIISPVGPIEPKEFHNDASGLVGPTEPNIIAPTTTAEDNVTDKPNSPDFYKTTATGYDLHKDDLKPNSWPPKPPEDLIKTITVPDGTITPALARTLDGGTVDTHDDSGSHETTTRLLLKQEGPLGPDGIPLDNDGKKDLGLKPKNEPTWAFEKKPKDEDGIETPELFKNKVDISKFIEGLEINSDLIEKAADKASKYTNNSSVDILGNPLPDSNAEAMKQLLVEQAKYLQQQALLKQSIGQPLSQEDATIIAMFANIGTKDIFHGSKISPESVIKGYADALVDAMPLRDKITDGYEWEEDRITKNERVVPHEIKPTPEELQQEQALRLQIKAELYKKLGIQDIAPRDDFAERFETENKNYRGE